uniref:Uncharacterized protein n=1 Tax=Anguilla anguilla TaxID=7936 RepID=A0A0E9PI23_ANGAN
MQSDIPLHTDFKQSHRKLLKTNYKSISSILTF